MALLFLSLLLLCCTIIAIGHLLIIGPQNEVARRKLAHEKMLYVGATVTSSTGLNGTIVAITKTHIIIASSNGQRHELAKSFIEAHEKNV